MNTKITEYLASGGLFNPETMDHEKVRNLFMDMNIYMKDTELLLSDVKKLCDFIVNSPPNTPIKGKIESMAWYIAHHPLVLSVE